VTYTINNINHSRGKPCWQRNYYEHILCSDDEYEQVEGYILNNPLNWGTDEENEKKSQR
jgi:hypothetical protein